MGPLKYSIEYTLELKEQSLPKQEENTAKYASPQSYSNTAYFITLSQKGGGNEN